MKPKSHAPLLLVGAGKMGGALLDGWIAKGVSPSSLLVLDPGLTEATRAALDARGVAVADSLTGHPAPATIVLAVKPQVFDAALPTIAAHVAPETLVLSIAAGQAIARIAAHLPRGTAIVRAMPNTPAAVGRGITVCCSNDKVTLEQKQDCTTLLEAVGNVEWIDDETLMDAVTAVSGSGPAYVFYLTECLAQAGEGLGLDRGLAQRLARATVSGSGELMARSDATAAGLREAVTSPGGTTAAALSVLEAEDGLMQLMHRAVEAAERRGRELGQG